MTEQERIVKNRRGLVICERANQLNLAARERLLSRGCYVEEAVDFVAAFHRCL